MQKLHYGYFTIRWLMVYGYLLILIVATPYLPLLIRQASAWWPTKSISAFVFVVEMCIGVFLIFLVARIFFVNRKKFTLSVLAISGIILFTSIFYLIIPNPYELTHLPEYAILSILLLNAIQGDKQKNGKKVHENSLYFRSALITGFIGAADEIYQGIIPLRHFTWYDIFLNGVGGILGLIVFWTIIRERVTFLEARW